jgi:aminoglycoside/choline kinase family phosphotransferase
LATEELSFDQRQWVFETIDILEDSPLKEISKLRIESSQRKFYRIFCENKKNYILMDVPSGIEESIDAFSNKSEFFLARDVKVPKVLARNDNLCLLIVEDFGDKLFQFNLSEENSDELYKSAIDQLIRIQDLDLDSKVFKSFDEIVMVQNWSMFENSFLNDLLGIKPSSEINLKLKNKYNLICKELNSQVKVICHYDFECRNLIFLDSGETGVLDFQDAMIGSIGLDLSSLFKDLYFFWSEEKINNWYQYFLDNSPIAKENDITLRSLTKVIDYCSLQRQFRILGKLSEVYFQLGRTNRLKDFPILMEYLKKTSRKYSELDEIDSLISPLLILFNKKVDELI